MSFDPATALFELAKVSIEKIFPDPTKRAAELRKLEKMKQEGRLAEMEAVTKLMLGQIEINKMEAQSKSLFVAGWRPFVGWVGAFAFAYISIIEPLARFVLTAKGYTGEYPVIDTTVTMQVLLGMLGLGIMRSFDKKNGVQTDKLK